MQELIQVFNFAGSEIRTITNKDNEVFFVAQDVCKILEINNVAQAVSRLDDDEKSDIILNDTSSNGVVQKRNFVIINESGLYSLVLSSRKAEAKAFKKWVTAEVLPAIRKHGKYEVKPLTTLETLELQVKLLKEQEVRMNGFETKLNLIEAKTTTRPSYFTIAGYATLHGISVNIKMASSLGIQATKLCKQKGLEIDSTNDPRFGKVNMYPEVVLKELFEKPL